jgi:hypothetical protein
MATPPRSHDFYEHSPCATKLLHCCRIAVHFALHVRAFLQLAGFTWKRTVRWSQQVPQCPLDAPLRSIVCMCGKRLGKAATQLCSHPCDEVHIVRLYPFRVLKLYPQEPG